MPSSFDFLGAHNSSAAELARSAEAFAHESPEVALFRMRQFAEKIVALVGREGRVVEGKKLADDIEALRNADRITPAIRDDLRDLKEFGNAAVHPDSDIGRKHKAKLPQHALDCLTVTHKIACWYVRDELGAELPSNEYEVPAKPPTRTKTEKVLAELQLEIERADDEAATDKLDSALERCEQVRGVLRGKSVKGMPAVGKGLLELRIESIERAVANHRGATTQFSPAEFAKSYRGLIESGENEVFERVCELGNRFAVAEFNAFRFDGAIDWLEKLVEGWKGRKLLATTLFGDVEVADYFLGTLLGSRGQAKCFFAHEMNDIDTIAEGIRDFSSALAMFTDSTDKDQQRVYMGHALLERLRLAAMPREADANFVDETRTFEYLEKKAEATAVALSKANEVTRDDFPLLFVLDVVLKAADLRQLGPPTWSRDFAALLARSINEKKPLEKPLQHPHEHLAGRLSLLLGDDCPKALRQALKRTADDDNQANGLVSIIAHAFLLEAEFRERGCVTDETKTKFLAARPPGMVAAWNANAFGPRFDALCATGGAGPLRILPFNYA